MTPIKKIIIVGLLSSMSLLLAADSKSHLGHIITSWPSAPMGMSLLDTALKEAKIVHLHIKLAQSQEQDLAWIKLHIRRSKHALDGSQSEQGGLGYGVIKASLLVAEHMKLATSASDASINIKLHSERIILGVNNTVRIARQMLVICDQVADTADIDRATVHVNQLSLLARALLIGQDANNDGEISAFDNESGLNFSAEQLRFTAAAERLVKSMKIK